MRTKLAIACILLAGCGVAEDDLDPERFTQTIVVLSPDGTKQVTTREVTAADQESELSADLGSHTRAIMQSSCAGADLQLFDRTGFTGNQLCFLGAGSDSLANYWDVAPGCGITCYFKTWVGQVRSYRSAATRDGWNYNGGDFWLNTIQGGYCRECFLPRTSRNAGWCAQHADNVSLVTRFERLYGWTCP